MGARTVGRASAVQCADAADLGASGGEVGNGRGPGGLAGVFGEEQALVGMRRRGYAQTRLIGGKWR